MPRARTGASTRGEPLDARALAQRRLADSGERPTRARLAILTLLLESDSTLTHDEVLARLAGSGDAVDRVTVYRVLEWLLDKGLAHRLAGDSRVWRFGAVKREQEKHLHFECRRCERVFCLEGPAPELDLRLPQGFKAEHAELNLKGQCPSCARAG